MKRTLYKTKSENEKLLLQNCTGPLEYVCYQESDWYKNRCTILLDFTPLCCTHIIVEYLVLDEFTYYKAVRPLDADMWKKFQRCYVQNGDGTILDLCSSLDILNSQTLSIAPWQPIWQKKHSKQDGIVYSLPTQYYDNSCFLICGRCHDISLELKKSKDEMYINLCNGSMTYAFYFSVEGKWISGCKKEFIEVLLYFYSQTTQSATEPFLLKISASE